MKHELDKMMDLIKDYKTGYGGVTDSFMRKELEMFAKDYYSEQCNMADASVSLLEEAANLVGNPGTNISGSCDIACMEWREKYERWRNER